MSRFYIKPENVKGTTIYIGGEEAHHILEVMRLKEGDRIVTFDGIGKEYEGVIRDVARGKAVVEITKSSVLDKKEGIAITLAQALPKKAKIAFIIEKATELGVDAIMPIHTARTVVRLDSEKRNSRFSRWGRIAVSASKQCGRLQVPKIFPITDFEEAIKKLEDYDLAIMACLHRDTRSLREILEDFSGKSIIVFIGPEGDFTEKEIEAASSSGCRLASLGPRVLRVDTASLNILSVLRYALS